MKFVLFTIALMSVAANCFAFPENLRAGTVSSIFYHANQECPFSYCENGDDGFSMRNWCRAHHGAPGSDPIVVGWATVSGTSCFCGCNQTW
jgi:hypothetical protein